MGKEHLATYTAEIKVRFKFDARESADRDVLSNMAFSYAELLLTTHGITKHNVSVVDKKVHYTVEEQNQRKREWEKLFENYKTATGDI